MVTTPSRATASEIANLTFKLLVSCQKKEEKIARQFGVTVAEFRVLRAFRASGSRNVKDIVAELELEGSSFSKIAANLETKGFLVRSIDPEDRRGVRVTLTAKGAALSRRLEARYIEIHAEILKDIPGELHHSVVLALERLFQSLDRWLGDEP